jgi:hypothetical protein
MYYFSDQIDKRKADIGIFQTSQSPQFSRFACLPLLYVNSRNMIAHSSNSTNACNDANCCEIITFDDDGLPRAETFNYLADELLCMSPWMRTAVRCRSMKKPASALRSPLQVFSRQVFIIATDSAEHRAKLRRHRSKLAAGTAGASDGARTVLRVGKTTYLRSRLAISDADTVRGFPIKKHFDWTIGVGRDGQVLLFGDAVNEQDEEQRAKDAAHRLLSERSHCLALDVVMNCAVGESDGARCFGIYC